MSSANNLLTVSEAVSSRRSCRDFLDKQVSYDLIMKILNESRWAPSSSNLQPWKLYLLHGENKQKLSKIIQSKLDKGVLLDVPAQFQMHPGVKVPLPSFINNFKQKFPKYYQRYSALGKARYTASGIKREDFESRMKEGFRAFNWFGAPVGLVLSINKHMVTANYPDLGLLLQTIMLLCQQYGLSTCCIGAWSLQHETLRKALNIPHDETIFCGLAIGYGNKQAAVNKFKRSRISMDEMVIIPEVADIDEVEKKFESVWWFKFKMAMLMASAYVPKYRVVMILVLILLLIYWSLYL